MAEHEKLIAEARAFAGREMRIGGMAIALADANDLIERLAAALSQPEGRAGESDSAPPVSSPGPTVERAKYASPVTRLVCCGNQGCFEDKGCETARWWTERMDAAGYRLTRKPHVVKPEESHE